jgi:hypothetical protein
LETLNALPLNMMSEESIEKHANHVEQAILTDHLVNNHGKLINVESPHKEKFRREDTNHRDVYDDVSTTSKSTNQQSTPMLIYGNYHQQKLGLTNPLSDSPSLSSVKQRRSLTTRPLQLQLPNFTNEKTHFYDKSNIVYVDDDSPECNEATESNQLTDEKNYLSNNSSPTHGQTSRLSPKIETFL